MTYYRTLSLTSKSRCHWIDITGSVQAALRESGMKNGICIVSSLHTTAAITINENADPDVERDFFLQLERIAPVDSGFAHAEGNSDSHCKTSLVGNSVTVAVHEAHLVLGTWQSIYFCEFDGPRQRTAAVSFVGESHA